MFVDPRNESVLMLRSGILGCDFHVIRGFSAGLVRCCVRFADMLGGRRRKKCPTTGVRCERSLENFYENKRTGGLLSRARKEERGGEADSSAFSVDRRGVEHGARERSRKFSVTDRWSQQS